jgi:hypothetical protein
VTSPGVCRQYASGTADAVIAASITEEGPGEEGPGKERAMNSVFYIIGVVVVVLVVLSYFGLR